MDVALLAAAAVQERLRAQAAAERAQDAGGSKRTLQAMLQLHHWAQKALIKLHRDRGGAEDGVQALVRATGIAAQALAAAHADPAFTCLLEAEPQQLAQQMRQQQQQRMQEELHSVAQLGGGG